MPSVFSKIIQGELPCYKIAEDEYTFSFLTRDAIQLGHTLVIPKVEIDYFLDVEEPHYTAVFQAAKPISRAIHEATGCTRVGTIIAGYEIPHFHFHLIPTWNLSDLSFGKARQYSDPENRAMQAKITAALQSSKG